MHRLLVIILSVMLTLAAVAPVLGQAIPATPEPVIVEPGSGLTVSLPEGSPWWAAIAVTVVGAGAYLIRGYSNRLDKKSQTALEAVKQEFTLKLKQLEIQATEKCVDAVQIDALAGSIHAMAKSVTDAYTALAEERAQAGREREAMRQTMDEQAKGIKERNQLLKAVGETVKTVDDKITPVVESVDEAVKELKTLSTKIDNMVTKDRFDGEMKEIRAVLDRVIGKLEHPAPPAETASADGGKMSAGETVEIA